VSRSPSSRSGCAVLLFSQLRKDEISDNKVTEMTPATIFTQPGSDRPFGGSGACQA
jgi:hypothetical protein